ncbi:MAG: DUF2325 domain-containing protein [Firmicutes bacterium]|nr:DUF2325 domain-containing protein [Bacillota bacterium]
MPDKAYDRVISFLAEKKTYTAGADGLAGLHEVMLKYRDSFMAEVARRQTGEAANSLAEEDEERVAGELRRLPKGGVIATQDGAEVFVPEVWVRNLGMEHGDLVSAVPLGMIGQSPLFEFTVEERRGLGNESDRVGIIGPVVYHGGQWSIYSEEEEELISLNPREIRNLSIGEGDLVEVAYPAGDISAARVAWKFDHDDPYLADISPGKRPPQRSAEKRPVGDVADPLLAGKTVLVVGGDLYKEAYKQNFERRGAKFQWETGFQGGQGKGIESKVRSADAVVLVTEMMSHRLPDVESMCKRHRKPFIYAPSRGATGAVRACQKVFLTAREGK